MGQSGTDPEGAPAGVETIGGFTINREQEPQVLQAEVVRPATTTTPVPPRPALPPSEREGNLRVIVNQSMFSDWDKHV